ncbi:MAG TPA: universal stress protein [Bacteroidia bacterium]|jgi:nucleotide-binding universal stress UspA family protein|nr:universal stress protein [Bacteroidia bacterium]
MKNHFKILVASDYSKAGDNAERYAIQFAKATNAELTFFHAFEESFYFPEKNIEFEKMNENPVRGELVDLKQHVADIYRSMEMKAEEANCRYIVRQGYLASELYSEAETDKVDFIVMGTHETDLLQLMVNGSHTWEVIKKAPIPVLAIPEEASFSNIKHIVFATEYRKGEIPVMNFLTNLAMLFDAELTILHVSNDVFSPEFEKEMFDRFKNEVKGLIIYNKLSLQLIHNNDLVNGLNSFCAKANANWLVMSHQKSLFFVSLLNPVSATKRMSFHTHVPLLAVPDAYKPLHETAKNLSGNGHTQKADLYEDFFL